VPHQQAGQGAEPGEGASLLEPQQQLDTAKLSKQGGLGKCPCEAEAQSEDGIEGIWFNRDCYEANSSSEKCLRLVRAEA
jgi:hypothetical protein